MKIRSNPFLVVVSMALVSSATLHAATLYWDGNDSTANADGGPGTWDTVTNNWDDALTAGATATWPSSGTDNDAVFGTPAGLVTIDAGGVSANDVTFGLTGYTVEGGTLTLNGTTNILTATAAVNNNPVTDLTISAGLAGTNGLTKAGVGNVILSGNNTGLSGIITINNATGTNNSGLNLSGANAPGGITQVDVGGTAVADGSFLGLANTTLGSGVTLNLSGQGGYSAPIGTLRATGGAVTVNGPVNLLTANVRISNFGATSLTLNGVVTTTPSTNGLSFRHAQNQGVILTNSLNNWGGTTVLGEGSLYCYPGALPATTNLQIGGSNPADFGTNGTFTRVLGNTAGRVQFGKANDGQRAMGFTARGGDLTVNLGGAGGDLVYLNTFAKTGATNATNIVTVDVTNLVVGMSVTGSGIPTDTTISTIGIGSITLTKAATTTVASNALTFYAAANNTRFNSSILVLNGGNADSALTFENPVDLNGFNRVIQTSANTATLTGGLKNSSATAAGLRKLGAGRLAHDPGAAHTVSLQSVQTSAGTLEVKSGTLTLSNGAGTTYSAAMTGFTVVGGSTFRLSGGTVDAQVALGSVFTAGHTTGGSGNFIQDGGTFDAGGREILNAYGAPGTSTINGGTFICGAFRVAQSTGTLNLNGGTLRASNLSTGGGTSTVNFNGGTLQAKASSTSFVPTTLTNTVVKAGGAVIDSNSFNVTIAHALTEDSGSPGGGLTKSGAGTLSLTGVNTYTGVTTISAGTVSIASLEDGGVSGNLGAATSDAANIVFGGGALQFSAASEASSNRGFTINAANSATFNVSNAVGVLAMTGTVPTTTGVLFKTGAGTLTLDPGAVSHSLGALSANGGELILKSGTYATTAKDTTASPNLSAYNIGAGARGGTLTIDGATLNVGSGNNLKIAAAANGNLSVKSGSVTSTELAIGHNGSGVATQSGGTVTVTNLYHQDGGFVNSFTLSGGNLTAQRIFNNTAGAQDFTLNLNGGTLKSASGTTNLIDNQNSGTQIAVLLGDGNTIIDTTASNAAIVRPMGDMPSVAGTFTKAGGNTLTLTGANTYTGPTSVQAGTLALVGGSQASPITVDSGAGLGFTMNSPTTSSSTVTFSGATPKVTVSGTPAPTTLMTASNITGTPVLDPAIPGFELAIEGGGTLLNLKAASGTPFSTWATTTNGLAGGDAAATADPDNDGIDNAVEFVIGGQPNPANPGANSSALAPTISTDETYLIFTFRRTDLSLTQPGIVIAAEYGSDLDGWTPAIHGEGGVVIVVTDEIEVGVDQVQVSIPKTLATGAKMFARLNVMIP